MAAKSETSLSPKEYLEVERTADIKSEYFSGQMWAMAGASRERNVIITNLVREISSHLRGKPYKTYANDLRVRVGLSGLYTYPDVVIVRGQPKFIDMQGDTFPNPTVLVEVLSPNTEAWDRGGKWAQFQRIPSLQEYVLVSQDAMLAERFVRQENGDWLYSRAEGPDAALSFVSLSAVVPLLDIYERIVFSDQV